MYSARTHRPISCMIECTASSVILHCSMSAAGPRAPRPLEMLPFDPYLLPRYARFLNLEAGPRNDLTGNQGYVATMLNIREPAWYKSRTSSV